MRRPLSALTALLLSFGLAVAACSEPTSEPTKLKITVAGLPDGADPEVIVEGPDGSTYVVTGDEELEVDPGDYIVSAESVSAAGSTYYTAFDFEALTVEADQTTSFEVDYRVEIPDHTSIVEASLADDTPWVVGSELVLPLEIVPADLDTSEYVIATGANTDTGVVVKRIETINWGADAVIITGEDVPLYEAMPKGVIQIGGDAMEPRSHVVPASYDSSGSVVVPAKQGDGDPLFEVGFGGYQAGITSKATNKNYPDVKNVKGCAFEIPPTKFSLDDFAIVPDSDIAWSDAGESTTVSLTIQGAYTVTTEAPFEAKCSIEAHLKDIRIDKLCKLLGTSKIARVGPVNLTCEVEAAVKANIHLTGDGEKTERKGVFTYGVVATRHPDGSVDGGTVSETHEAVETENESTEGKYSVELTAEVSIGGELLWLLGAALAAEQAIAIEESEEEIKVPFKGKIFLKYGIGAGDTNIEQEVQIFHWSTNLYYLAKNGPDKKPSPSPEVPAGSVPRITIPWDGYDDPDVIQAAIDDFVKHEGEKVRLAIEAAFDESFGAYLSGEGPVGVPADILMFTPQDCELDECPVLYIHLPEGVPAITDTTGMTGVEYTFAGEFVVARVELYTEYDTHFDSGYYVYLEEA